MIEKFEKKAYIIETIIKDAIQEMVILYTFVQHSTGVSGSESSQKKKRKRIRKKKKENIQI